MFSQDPEVKEQASNCTVEYLSKIITTYYRDLEVTHNKSRHVNEACPGKIIPDRDQ